MLCNLFCLLICMLSVCIMLGVQIRSQHGKGSWVDGVVLCVHAGLIQICWPLSLIDLLIAAEGGGEDIPFP